MTLLQRDRENIELGREEGQQKMAALTKYLLSENRMDELKRALEDTEYCDELFEKYNI